MVSRQLSFMTACDIGDSLIAIDAFGIGIFRIDKQDMSSHLIVELEDMGKRYNKYQAAELCNNEIFFFSVLIGVEYRVIVYHLDSQRVEYLDLRNIRNDILGRYEIMYRSGNCIWMFPWELTRDIFCFHLDSRQIEAVPQWKNVVKEIKLDCTGSFNKVGNVLEVQNVLYHTIKGTNRLIGIDKKHGKIECYTIPVDTKFYIRMDYDGKKFWIAECDNQGVVSWDPVTQEARRYSVMFPKEEQKKYNWIETILCGAKYLWLIPLRDRTLIRMNYETGKCEYIEIFPQQFRVRKGNDKVFGLIQKDNDIVDLYPFFSNLVIHLDLKQDMLLENYEQILLPTEWSGEDIAHYQLQHEFESDRVSFDTYIDFLSQTDHQANGKEDSNTIGDNIWRRIRRSDI